MFQEYNFTNGMFVSALTMLLFKVSFAYLKGWESLMGPTSKVSDKAVLVVSGFVIKAVVLSYVHQVRYKLSDAIRKQADSALSRALCLGPIVFYGNERAFDLAMSSAGSLGSWELRLVVQGTVLAAFNTSDLALCLEVVQLADKVGMDAKENELNVAMNQG